MNTETSLVIIKCEVDDVVTKNCTYLKHICARSKLIQENKFAKAAIILLVSDKPRWYSQETKPAYEMLENNSNVIHRHTHLYKLRAAREHFTNRMNPGEQML